MEQQDVPIISSAWLKSMEDVLSKVNKDDPHAFFAIIKIYEQAKSYETLAPYINKDVIATAYLSSDIETVRTSLIDSFKQAEATFSTLPTQVKQTVDSEANTLPIEEQYIETRANELEQARIHLPQVKDVVRKNSFQANRSWINDVTNAWVKNLPKQEQALAAQKISQEIEQSYTHIPETAVDPKEISQTITSQIPEKYRPLIKIEQIEQHITQSQEELSALNEKIDSAVFTSPKPIITLSRIQETATTNINLDISPTVFSQAIGRVASQPISTSPSAQPTSTNPYVTPVSQQFFTSIASTSFQKALAPIADIVTSIFPKETQDRIYASVMSKSWFSTSDGNKANAFQSGLGAVFTSPQIDALIQRGNATFSSSKGSPSLTSAPVNFATDVFSTIFSAPVSEVYIQAAAGNPQFFQNQTNVNTIQSQQLYMALMGQGGNAFADWAGKKGASYVANKAGSKVVQKGASLVAGKTIGATIGGFLGTFLGPGLGTVIGTFIGSVVVDKLFGLLKTAATGIFTFIPNFFNKIMSGDDVRDGGFWGALGFVGIIIIFFVFIPLPISQTFMQFNQLSTALVPKEFDIVGEGVNVNCSRDPMHPDCLNPPVSFCLTNPTAPVCAITSCVKTATNPCVWPVSGSGAHVTQLPFGSYSHSKANAVDFGAPMQTPIYSVTGGVIYKIVNVDADGSMRGTAADQGYGNYVIVKTPENKLLIYAHMSFDSMNDLSNPLTINATVEPNQIIGRVDDTGNSSGPHLHFGYVHPGGSADPNEENIMNLFSNQ